MSLLLAGTRTRVRLRTKPALLPRQIEIKEYEDGDTSLQWRLVGATDWIDIIDIADLPEGPQGPQGDPGATGATGAQGPQGDPGPAGSGSGDVIGPASSVNNQVALFDGATGKLLKDSGVVLGTAAASATGDFATAAQGTLAGTALQPAAIGVSVQAYAANLTEWATLNPSANAGSLVTAADYAAMRALLDLEVGTDFLSPAAIAAAYQPLDADLTSWAGVTRASGFDTFTATPSSANLRSLLTDETGTGGAVFANTPTLVTPNIGAATGTSLSLGGVAVPTISSTNTLTNKRVTPRVTSEASSATPTINTDNCEIHRITALAVAITSMSTNLSGTPTHGQPLTIEITGTAARAITWGASFEASTTPLPTTTVSTDMLAVGFKWNSATSKWRCLAVA